MNRPCEVHQRYFAVGAPHPQPRTHSLFRQGLTLYHIFPNWPAERIRPLMETFGPMLMEQRVPRSARIAFRRMLMEQRVYREVFGVI